MALQKPYNINIRGQTLDSADPIITTWQVTGDLSVAYQVNIYKNSDNSLIYNSTKLTSFAQNHTIPSNSIPNGQEYKIQITIWNQFNQSISSDNEIFQTSSRPKVTISTLSIIPSSSYSFSATYSQAQSNPIRSWVVYLYNSSQVKIAQSSISTNPTIEYVFSELKSDTTYYIEFQVTSAKGLTGTTELVPFNVQYLQPDVKINLTSENVDNAGIKLSWNTIQIIGQTVNAPVFVNGESINLTNDIFSFEEGFSINQDFTIKIWIDSLIPDVDLLVLKSANEIISLQYWNRDKRFHLFKDCYGYKAHYVSKPVENSAGFFVCIQQIFSDINIFSEVV